MSFKTHINKFWWHGFVFIEHWWRNMTVFDQKVIFTTSFFLFQIPRNRNWFDRIKVIRWKEIRCQRVFFVVECIIWTIWLFFFIFFSLVEFSTHFGWNCWLQIYTHFLSYAINNCKNRHKNLVVFCCCCGFHLLSYA